MKKKIMQWIGAIIECIGLILLLMNVRYWWGFTIVGLFQFFLWSREEGFSLEKWIIKWAPGMKEPIRIVFNGDKRKD